MSTKVLSRIETVLMTAGFLAIAADIVMLALMYSLPVVQHPLRAFYIPVLAAETYLHIKQMQREETRQLRAQRAAERQEREEQWLREYEAFRRKVHR